MVLLATTQIATNLYLKLRIKERKFATGVSFHSLNSRWTSVALRQQFLSLFLICSRLINFVSKMFQRLSYGSLALFLFNLAETLFACDIIVFTLVFSRSPLIESPVPDCSKGTSFYSTSQRYPVLQIRQPRSLSLAGNKTCSLWESFVIFISKWTIKCNDFFNLSPLQLGEFHLVQIIFFIFTFSEY